MQFLTGFLLASAAAWTAWKVRALSRSGALSAVLLGTVVFGFGGLRWAVLLLGFFISSSGLSFLFKRYKTSLDEKFSKGSVRDWAQVLANGGIAGICVILAVFDGGRWSWVIFAGALAAVNADTWATELGVLSPKAPRLITNGKTVERGTSGGVSLWGVLAAFAGAGFIAALAVAFWPGNEIILDAAWWVRWLGISLAGLGGSLVDSLLGATGQAIYFCPACKKETERYPMHTCGSSTRLVRGWKWMNNDRVNLICSLAGGLLAGMWFILW